MRFFLLTAQLLASLALIRAAVAPTSLSTDDLIANLTATTPRIAAPVSSTKNLFSKDGTNIYAQAVGNPAGPHIIFAHGFGCTLTSFDLLFENEQLKSILYMVRYDTRGHGLSGKPLTPDFYTTDRYADDLKAIITGFNLNKPFFAGWQVQLIFWSLGGAISADITANFPHPLPFSGLIYLAGLPYLGDILSVVATPLVLSFIPGIQNLNDTTLGLQTRIDFINALSAKTDIPYATKLGWVGSSVYLPPTIATRVLTRTQDPTSLFAEGAAGWPLLILNGLADLQINGSAVISNMAPKFKNVESHLIPGAGHILFYDAADTVARYILAFIARIKITQPYPIT